jgi:hypothetical protein
VKVLKDNPMPIVCWWFFMGWESMEGGTSIVQIMSNLLWVPFFAWTTEAMEDPKACVDTSNALIFFRMTRHWRFQDWMST